MTASGELGRRTVLRSGAAGLAGLAFAATAPSVARAAELTCTIELMQGHAVVIDHLLFAALLPDPPAQKWIITHAPGHDRNVFTIETADRRAGWVLPSAEPKEQIAVRPLIVGPSVPPFYPSNELWVITPASGQNEGSYFITSKVNDLGVGRAPIEDHSLNPKAVVTRPANLPPYPVVIRKA
ncbi:I66 family serine proteinase inhibitor [Streptomyces sp. NPDC059832]|uniref:I66 family serine proteinase inhibitor n=1 Tax=Streptomyces sp. NPDC059832 TaxID=3346966 RepID=UPI00365BBC7B